MDIKSFLYNLPEVSKPVEKKLSFSVKLKWTIIVLLAFFILANIPLYGVTSSAFQQFESLAVLLGTEFGSIISLGIGPIVMSSIILQLLVGSGILSIDLNSTDGKRYFQGLQKLGVIGFILLEASIYVLMGGFQPVTGFAGIVIFQLILGGLAIMFMDEVSAKWGFGSGISLFILAGVAWRLFTGLFQFIDSTGVSCLADFGSTPCVGKVLVVLQSIINQSTTEALGALAVIVTTIIIFLAVVWAQSLKVEIPLSFDRLRGYGMKWPLAFFYASNIPVILTAALVANIQWFGILLEKSIPNSWIVNITGHFSSGQPIPPGLSYWLGHSNIVDLIIKNAVTTPHLIQAFTHLAFFMIVSTIFAVFWVKTAGMDESSQAKKILASGLQIPGFRKDERILESILSRYILPLTIMGGLTVGALAAISDSIGALTSGTSILLAVMIAYQFYQNIAQQHAVDMHPSLRKMMA